MVGSADLAPIILIIVFAAIIIMWRDNDGAEGFALIHGASYSDTKICPDGRKIGISESCDPVAVPVQPAMQQCWNGTQIPTTQTCPPMPGPTPVVVPGPVSTVKCATVADINRLIRSLDTWQPPQPPQPTPQPPSKGWTDEQVADMDVTKEDIFTECPDGSFVKKGQKCGKAPRVASDGFFSVKFGPVKDQVWIDPESTRLRTRFPPGTPFDFVIENNIPGKAVFNQAKTVQAYSIKITGAAASKINIGKRPEIAITTEIYATTPAAARETPNQLVDAVGTVEDIKKETMGIYNDANFKNVMHLVASGKAFQRVKSVPGWVYFRVGTDAGAAKGSPFFRMRQRKTGVQNGLLGILVQQYQASRKYWVPQTGNTPYIPTNKNITILELKPKWENAYVLPVTVGQIKDGEALPNKKISNRFLPQPGVKGTGADRYQEVWDENTNVMGKYYLQTKRFVLPGINENARLRCPAGRKMRKNTSCEPIK